MLFGLDIDFLIRVAVDKNKSGLALITRCSSIYSEGKIAYFHYADDIALFEGSDTEMSETTEAIRALAEDKL